MDVVYVSNAQDGTIAIYALDPARGELRSVGSTEAGALVMPLAVSADRRFLYAAIRSKPFTVATYRIAARTGALTHVSSASLPDSMAYISTDRSGRFLLSASYGGDVIAVNPIDAQGAASGEQQVVKTGRHAHAILADRSNRFVYATILGTDQVLQFDFDQNTGALTPSRVPFVRSPARAGPRHFVFSPDGRFLYVLNELAGTVTSFLVDPRNGNLTEVATVEGVPKHYGLEWGVRRPPAGATSQVDNTPRIWASDIHVTPDGRFLFLSERTSSSISALASDPSTGALVFLGNHRVERQPRAFNIDSHGRFLVVAGEKSPEVGVYAIDPINASLARVHAAPAGQGACWVEVIELD